MLRLPTTLLISDNFLTNSKRLLLSISIKWWAFIEDLLFIAEWEWRWGMLTERSISY